VHSFIRALAFLVGTGILAAVAHVTILSTGGYAQPAAAMVIALACGVAVGAVAIGQALTHGRRAGLLALALLAGEGFGLLRTADMLVTTSEARQAPVRDAIARREAAEARLAAAGASDAVRRAEQAKVEINTKAMATSAEKTCGANCRLVLDAQVSAAARAVETARTGTEAEIAAARAELGRTPMPASASPVADRLGLPSWALDLILAALGSVGCNGLAACLLAFAAHGPRLGPAIEAPNLGPVTVTAEPENLAAPGPRLGRSVLELPAVEVTERGDIDAFMLERVQATRGGRISWARLFTEYVAWCRTSGAEPVSASAFGQRMDELRDELGRDVRENNGQVYFVGLGLKRLRLAAN